MAGVQVIPGTASSPARRASDAGRLLALAATAAAFACGAPPTPERLAPAAGPPPANVVLVTLDTLRADRLGCYGHDRETSPNLDAFAAGGVRFERATTVTNNTLPSHLAMLIGRYPQEFGVPRNGFRLPQGHDTLATILAAEGYDTAAFISASALASSLGLDRGFAVYDEAFDTAELDQDQRRAATTIDAALEWLGTPRAAPFLLWVHLFDPHYPYSPPAPYDTRFDPDYAGDADGSIEYLSSIGGVRGYPKRAVTAADLRHVVALYDGEIAYMDHHLGRLLDALAAPELAAHTGVIVVADHGESLTEHDYFFDHGEYVYQPSMHVPLLVRPPGRDAAPGVPVVETPVETLDVLATALGMAGVEVPAGLPSRDLAPLWRGDGGWPPRLSFGEGCRPWTVEERYPELWPNAAKWQFVLDWPWKLVAAPYLKQGGLYDLESDPGELRDLSAANPATAERLWRALGEWRESAERSAMTLDADNAERLRALGYVE